MKYKIKRFSWFFNRSKKESFELIIKENFSWALNYIDRVDSIIEKENSKLVNINPELAQFYYLATLGNNITDLTDFIVDFRCEEYLGTIKPKYIKYDPDSNSLVLKTGYPIARHYPDGTVIKTIKNKSDLVKEYKSYYNEFKKSISLDSLIYGWDNDDIEAAGGKEEIKKYWKELLGSIDTIYRSL